MLFSFQNHQMPTYVTTRAGSARLISTKMFAFTFWRHSAFSWRSYCGLLSPTVWIAKIAIYKEQADQKGSCQKLVQMCIPFNFKRMRWLEQHKSESPASILLKYILDRYRPDRIPVGPITARYRFKKNASWQTVWSVDRNVRSKLFRVCSIVTADVNCWCHTTVEPRYLEFAYLELLLISKWKSGPLLNMKVLQQVTKYCGKEEKFFSSFPRYFQYVPIVRSQIKYSFVKCGYSVQIGLSSVNLLCRGTDISKYFRGFLGLQDNESRLYMIISKMICLFVCGIISTSFFFFFFFFFFFSFYLLGFP